MNPLCNTGRAALMVLACSSATVLAQPDESRGEPYVQSAYDAMARSSSIGVVSSKSMQAPSMTSVAPVHSKAALHVTQQLVDFLTHLSSTSDITIDRVGKQFGGTLTAEDGHFVYRSGDLGSGWNYGVKVILPSKAFKAGFNFGFYNPQRDADPTPICALSLDTLRRQLLAHGYAETFQYSEIGGVDSVEFVRNDIVLTVLGANLVTAPNGDECFNIIQTIDGR